MGDTIVKLYQKQNFVIGEDILKAIKHNNLTLDETLLIIYFCGMNKHAIFDVEDIEEKFGMDEPSIMKAFSQLSSKNLIDIKMVKNKDNKMEEVIDLTPIYESIAIGMHEKAKNDNAVKVFTSFESEFGRPLSSMEVSIINSWLDKGIEEELINKALKEAIFNGTLTLRYIDAIISEWTRKGFKTGDEVDIYLKKKVSNKPKIKKDDLFDYNWLDDDE